MKSALRVAVAALSLLGAGVVRAADAPGAPYHFALAKMLVGEGSFREAVAEFRRALELEPADPYLRLEYAELLFRLAQVAAPAQRGERLTEAAVQVEEARRLAPASPDVLRAAGQIHMARAEQEPQALAAARAAWEELRRVDPGDVPAMIGLGQIYLGQGEPERAAEVFADVLHRRPDDPTLAALLVDALVKAGRGADAIPVLEELLAAHPQALDARLQLSDLLGQSDRHREAVAVLAAAPPHLQASVELRRRLAFHLFQTGDAESALATVESVLAEDADYFGGRFLRALALSALARNQEAAAELRALYARSPAAVEVALVLARVERRLGDGEEAAGLLESLAQRLESAGSYEDADRVRVQLGVTLGEARQWERVLAAIAPARQRGAALWREDLAQLAAEALSSLGRSDEALALLDQAAAEPGSDAVELAARRAQVLHRAGRESEAEESLERLAAAGADQRLAAAEAYQQLELWDRSIALLAAAPLAEGDPRAAHAEFLLGAAYERSGRRAEAIAVFRRLLGRQPEHAPALNYLGYMLAEKGENLQEALELVRRAVALDPDNGAYIDSLGWAHYQRGEYDEARRYLERAAGLVPDDATVAEHLADLYAALGQRARARDLYQRALDLNGDNADELRRKLSLLGGGT